MHHNLYLPTYITILKYVSSVKQKKKTIFYNPRNHIITDFFMFLITSRPLEIWYIRGAQEQNKRRISKFNWEKKLIISFTAWAFLCNTRDCKTIWNRKFTQRSVDMIWLGTFRTFVYVIYGFAIVDYVLQGLCECVDFSYIFCKDLLPGNWVCVLQQLFRLLYVALFRVFIIVLLVSFWILKNTRITVSTNYIYRFNRFIFLEFNI